MAADTPNKTFPRLADGLSHWRDVCKTKNSMLTRRLFSGFLATPLLLRSAPATSQQNDLLIFAAASLKDVLGELAALFRADSGVTVLSSLAGSSQLARQIEAGAPADVFISADMVWMDWLGERSLIRAATRRVVATNQLVLIAPATSDGVLPDAAWETLPDLLGQGRLAMGQPDSVPAGRYARESLTRLGLWQVISGRTAETENVRAALQLVARGEAPLGIVYASDAKASAAVKVIAAFPAESHEPILYPAAVLAASAHPFAEAFVGTLISAKGQAAFQRAGFGPPA